MLAEELAKGIKLLVLDVDGVLTDGGLYYDKTGQVMKRFHVQDGLGIKLAQAAGLEIAVISGLDSPAVEKRIRELGISDYYPGFNDKLPRLEELKLKKGIEYRQMAFLGDDWVDARPMQLVGLPMAVANARPEIKGLARWISTATGGNGAVREAIDFLLTCQAGRNSCGRSGFYRMLKKTIPFLFIGLLLMFFIWRWLSNFTPEIQKIKKDLAVDLSLQGITLKQGKDGQIIWELTAKRANYSEEKKEIFLDEPRIVYYVGQDRKKLNIFAPQGKVNQQKDEAELWPQVAASYEDISLRANRARYKGKMKKIFLEGPVEARKGFDASQGGNASTSLSNHGMVLKAKKAVINLETETIEAVGGVNAIFGRTLP